MRRQLTKVISGGQTGVDRAALDVALEYGIACGGYCPDGRLAEDGQIDARYPLTELQGGGYIERTLENVLQSDGTLIIYSDVLEGGTLLTQQFCDKKDKPYLTVDKQCYSIDDAVHAIDIFVQQHTIHSLNVAGPRASKNEGIYQYTYDVMKVYFARYK